MPGKRSCAFSPTQFFVFRAALLAPPSLLDIRSKSWQNWEVRESFMKSPFIPKWIVFVLISGTLLLPMAITVILGVGHLLSTMGDTAGGGVLGRIALALGILWGLDLIVLVVILAVQSLDDHFRE
jgi:hypothetical protein